MQSIVNSTDFRISKKIKENDKEICKRIYNPAMRRSPRKKNRTARERKRTAKEKKVVDESASNNKTLPTESAGPPPSLSFSFSRSEPTSHFTYGIAAVMK